MIVKVKPWELKPGDRILGTELVVAGPFRYMQTDIGSDMERQHYVYPLTNGAEIPYNGSGPGPQVIRAEDI